MAAIPPKLLRTPLHSKMAGASSEGGMRRRGSAISSAEPALASAGWSLGPASGVTTVPSTEPAPAMNTERRMSGRSSRSARAAAEAHLALLEEDGPLGELEGHVDRLLDDDDRGAAGVQHA